MRLNTGKFDPRDMLRPVYLHIWMGPPIPPFPFLGVALAHGGRLGRERGAPDHLRLLVRAAALSAPPGGNTHPPPPRRPTLLLLPPHRHWRQRESRVRRLRLALPSQGEPAPGDLGDNARYDVLPHPAAHHIRGGVYQ